MHGRMELRPYGWCHSLSWSERFTVVCLVSGSAQFLLGPISPLSTPTVISFDTAVPFGSLILTEVDASQTEDVGARIRMDGFAVQSRLTSAVHKAPAQLLVIAHERRTARLKD